jgi:hypothetical protein
MTNLTLTKKANTHSKALFELIDEQVEASVLLLDMSSDLDDIVNLLEFTIYEERENYKIDQINVVGDSRNNKMSDMRKGKYNIDIYFRHKNCFNITHISYTIEK